MPNSTILRLMDANANRALEGLRVCEEIIRFHLGSPSGFRRTRTLRHAIALTVNRLPVSRMDLVQSRDSRQDPGRRSASERVGTLERLLAINFQRTKESLRTLEECARLIAPRQSRAFQRLRFCTYDLERAILLRLAALRHP